MHTAQFCFDGISLFLEQDVGTHLYITESHIMYSFSCLFIRIMMECDKGHKFVICCIVLHQQNFIGIDFSMLKISLPEVLLCSFLQCEKLYGVMHNGILYVPHQIPVHLFGILFAHISDHDPLQGMQGMLGFLLLPSVLGIS